MKHRASSRFWEAFHSLPKAIQESAKANFAILKQDETHPALRFKFVLNGRYRSVRIGLRYRALGVPTPDGVLWFWIGSHAEYDRILNQ